MADNEDIEALAQAIHDAECGCDWTPAEGPSEYQERAADRLAEPIGHEIGQSEPE